MERAALLETSGAEQQQRERQGRHTATTGPRPGSHRRPTTQPRLRDTLTGTPLATDDPGALIYVTREQLVVTGYAPLAWQDDPNVVAPPGTLHVHPFHGGTERVGLRFAPIFARYLAAVMRELRVRDTRDLSAWWASDYGIARVRRGLALMYTPLRARQILDMVLVCAREEATPERVASEYHHSIGWLARTIANCQWLADKPASVPIRRYHMA